MVEKKALRRGAVALVDALGFKGIWERIDAEAVIGALLATKASTGSEVSFWRSLSSKTELSVSFFSDTIVIAVTAKDESDISDSDLVEAVVTPVHGLLMQSLLDPPHLTYRGCIALGRLLVNDVFFIGPAIDEAAAWYEKADAGAVWLLPSAAEAVDRDSEHLRVALLAWDVPLKAGGTVSTLVVNPLTRSGQPGHLVTGDWPTVDELQARLMATFDGALVDVSSKRANTRRLLDLAASRIAADHAEHPVLEFDIKAMVQALARDPVGTGAPAMFRPKKECDK